MKSILVAEDRESSRELIRAMLEHLGYTVLEAANATDAVQMARDKYPDLVLVDLQMPLRSGFKVLQALRADPHFAVTPIVALTSEMMQNDREKAFKDGFAAYLTKPLSLAEIRRELSFLLVES